MYAPVRPGTSCDRGWDAYAVVRHRQLDDLVRVSAYGVHPLSTRHSSERILAVLYDVPHKFVEHIAKRLPGIAGAWGDEGCHSPCVLVGPLATLDPTKLGGSPGFSRATRRGGCQQFFKPHTSPRPSGMWISVVARGKVKSCLAGAGPGKRGNPRQRERMNNAIVLEIEGISWSRPYFRERLLEPRQDQRVG